ncbi:hypothetical protein BLNAU_9881 [Blattamonas nauphoetae]|uniref:Uncharacterized protein n=1 Tax=Blattamonas nauphoetae TaxID=2049346 RepID=A0ABQ9XUK4_9EUKA|nr:hypothetical protein BLNAU_9881 [Blattamonas nauphoetae]
MNLVMLGPNFHNNDSLSMDSHSSHFLILICHFRVRCLLFVVSTSLGQISGVYPDVRLMEWFLEATIGVEVSRKHNHSAPPLTFENVRIDTSFSILIDSSSTRQEPQSVTSRINCDFSILSSLFLDIHRTLERQKRLILPLEFKDTAVVYSRLMVALVEHFVASGDLIVQNMSPNQLSQYFVAVVHRFLELHGEFVLSLNINLANLFCVSVLSPLVRNYFVQTNHSYLCGDDLESSEQLLDAVDHFKETHSMETIQNLYYDWKEWVTMMLMVVQGAESLTDLSFLQSRCFRSTLLSLQTKHQFIINPSEMKESTQMESSSEDLRYEQARLPFRSDCSLHSLSSLSTETQFPSHSSSSFSGTHLLSSPQPPQLNQPAREASSLHSREILTVIHSLLSKPTIDSFQWVLRKDIATEKDWEIMNVYPETPVSLDERFGPSLFDESDDTKLAQTLTRCRKVVKRTKSIQCIDSLDSFLQLIVACLHHSNQLIAGFSFRLFKQIIKFLPLLDPRSVQFLTLRTAFRDGTPIEQRALLHLWSVWFNFQTSQKTERDMNAADFDFDGLLAADLTGRAIFDEACLFVIALFSSAKASMTWQWKSNFIIQFENSHHVLDRLAGKPGPWSDKLKSQLSLTPEHIFIAGMLCIFHGASFQSELTVLITIDLDSSPLRFERYINTAHFLNHTSIPLKHRHSFFPMDLMFERCLREEPALFIIEQPDLTICSVRKFLNTPLVGLHSLLVRSMPLTFNARTLHELLSLFVDFSRQQISLKNVHRLYSSFPPPRLLDTLLSAPHIIRTSKPIWIELLHFVRILCENVAPFGACLSLANVFRMLNPFDSTPREAELDLLSRVGSVVVSLHWLSIPAHFDSPLLCHLPSLAGAQRGVLQTLSSHSGIPSLVAPLTKPFYKESSQRISSDGDYMNKSIAFLSLSMRYLASEDCHRLYIKLSVQNSLFPFLLSPSPAVMSAAFEFFVRFVSVSSDALRMDLVRNGFLDSAVFAVSNSSFLDDYEKGITVIGILLDTIRRDYQKNEMTSTFD